MTTPHLHGQGRTARAPDARLTPEELAALKVVLDKDGVTYADWLRKKIQEDTMTPIAKESRNCFGIEWFLSEEDADKRGAEVVSSGVTYNGGFLDGKLCGRDKNFDRTVEGVKQYAVTN